VRELESSVDSVNMEENADLDPAVTLIHQVGDEARLDYAAYEQSQAPVDGSSSGLLNSMYVIPLIRSPLASLFAFQTGDLERDELCRH
jgi:hypothetical protein